MNNNNNTYLLVCAIKILKSRINKANSPQVKNALIFAHNLLVYILRNDRNMIEEILEKEGIKE